jgi:hypothetical protein
MSNKKVIFYKKEGKKYVPVYEYDSELLDAYPKGTHVVVCYPGGKSTRFNINPNHAAMIAAGQTAADAISKAIMEASSVQMKRNPMSDRELEAWHHLIEVWGDEARTITYPSACSIAEAGVKAMCEEAEKLMEHPAVKDAYNKFLMVCELVKEEKNG